MDITHYYLHTCFCFRADKHGFISYAYRQRSDTKKP